MHSDALRVHYLEEPAEVLFVVLEQANDTLTSSRDEYDVADKPGRLSAV